MVKSTDKLNLWQGRLQEAENGLEVTRDDMNKREGRYNGDHVIYDKNGKEAKEKPLHVRNVCLEMVETQVESAIPAPKVTAVRPEDEGLARVVEQMISNVMDRLPMERINDLAERISPVQGGFGLLVGWDSTAAGCGWMGKLTLDLLHPREIIPQPGVYEVEDMDYIFLKQARTKRQIKERYGVDVKGEEESDPGTRGADDTVDPTGQLVTQCTAYYRHGDAIGRFVWVNDTVLEDLDDYQARRVHICRVCGAVGDGRVCRYCGSRKFDDEKREYETLTEDISTALGHTIPAEEPARDELGQILFEPVTTPDSALLPHMEPAGGLPLFTAAARQQQVAVNATKIPYFRPGVYPVIIRKNVSKPGHFWGGSDVDAIEDQQNSLNKLGSKMQKKVLASGSFVTTPKGAARFINDNDVMVMEVANARDMGLNHSYNVTPPLDADLRLRSETYEEARQIIGVTDAMQGRRDPTATSAVAKQFSAQQAQGRLESKRVMKRALFQDLFERIFLTMLAYCDQPRQVRGIDVSGDTEYLEFNRYDFLYQDEAGQWHWNTDFLFSCDDAAPLAKDRQAMWQETRLNFKDGTFGPPGELTSVLRFWEQMTVLHYPMAGAMKEQIRQELQRQQEAQAVQAGEQAAQTGGQVMPGGVPVGPMAPAGEEPADGEQMEGVY